MSKFEQTEYKQESSTEVQKRIEKARQIQQKRYQEFKNIHTNGQLGAREIDKICILDVESAKLLTQSVDSLGLSARGYHRILKLARTIADLDDCDKIRFSHVVEAIQYRRGGFLN